MSIAQKALELVPEGADIGLGTGRAAAEFVRALGAKVAAGFRIRGVPTSEATAKLAAELNIPMATLEEVEGLAVTFDGADAIDPNLDLIKGLGGALLREKVVAASSGRFVVLAGEEKVTPILGQGYCKRLPLEVIPFGLAFVQRRLKALGHRAELRMKDGRPFVTDNGNYTLDLDVSGTIADPAALERTLRGVPGIADTGLFLGMADLALVQAADGSVRELRRPAR